MARTDGATATSTAGDSGAPDWDSMLAEGISSTGVDPSGSFEDAPATEAASPQQADPVSSDGALTGRPSTPQTAPAGDDGQGTTAPVGTPPPPAPVPDATPFTYTGADGATRTIDGAMVLPGDGLYVPEAQIPHFQQLASTAEQLERTNRSLYDRFSALERVTTWKESGPNGERTLSGMAGVEAIRANAAFNGEALRGVLAVLTDPEQFATLHDVVQDAQGNYAIVPNEKALHYLMERATFSAEKASWGTKQQFTQMAAPPPPPEATVEELAGPTVQAQIKALNVTLTPQDEQFLVGQFPRYVRQSTPQEAKQYGSARIVDQSFAALVSHTADRRAEAAKAAEVSTKASTFNQGMQRGRTPVPRPAPTRAPASVPTEKVGKAAAWANILESGLDGIVL